jgi:general secretion pathway protein C
VFVDVKLVLSRPIVPQSICFVLSLLLIWQIVVGVISFFSLDKSMSLRHDQVSEVKIEAKRVVLNADMNAALFGEYVPHNLNDAVVKQSMLDLKVVGIMFSTNEKESHVILRTAGGQEHAFGVGDSLPGGAIIKRITADGMLISRNGALESLSLKKKKLTFEAPAAPLGVSN